jgi:nitrogen regulatory protein P-II 2
LKLISTTIRLLDIDAVGAAMRRLGVDLMTLTEVQRFGRTAWSATPFRDAKYIIDHLPHVRVEAAVEDNMLTTVIEAMASATGAHDHEPYLVKELLIHNAAPLALGLVKSIDQLEEFSKH